MKKALRELKLSIVWRWKCTICLHEITRAMSLGQVPPIDVTCPRCYSKAVLMPAEEEEDLTE